MPRLDANGVNTRYLIEGGGPRLILAHGVGSSLESWDGVVAALGGEFETLRYDLRGHGASSAPEGPYALADFCDDLVGLLDALAWDAAHLAGFSLGGLIAQAFALAHAPRLDRLAIISAVAGRSKEERAAVVRRADRLAEGRADDHLEEAMERWFSPEFRAANPDLLTRRADQATQADAEGYAAAYRVFAESDLANELHRIDSPTVVITGEHDPGSNVRMARLMHERISGSSLVILPRLRHAVLAEAPLLVAAELRSFFA